MLSCSPAKKIQCLKFGKSHIHWHCIVLVHPRAMSDAMAHSAPTYIVMLLLRIAVNVRLILLVQIRLAARVGALAFQDGLTSSERMIFWCDSFAMSWTLDRAGIEMRVTASFGGATFAGNDVSVREVLWFKAAGANFRLVINRPSLGDFIAFVLSGGLVTSSDTSQAKRICGTGSETASNAA
jgi:hypothetical protein